MGGWCAGAGRSELKHPPTGKSQKTTGIGSEACGFATPAQAVSEAADVRLSAALDLSLAGPGECLRTGDEVRRSH